MMQKFFSHKTDKIHIFFMKIVIFLHILYYYFNEYIYYILKLNYKILVYTYYL